MKKITWLFLVFFVSACGYSQVVFQEGFEGTSLPGDSTPGVWTLGSGDWSVFTNGVGPSNQQWTVNTGVATPPLICEGARSAYINRENIGQNNTEQDYLATPVIHIPDNGQLRFTTRLTLAPDDGTIFKIMFAPAASLPDNPGAYTVIQQYAELDLVDVYNLCQTKIIGLSALAGQDVRLAFVREYTQTGPGTGGDRWLVDNVQVVNKCLDPTNAGAINITQNSATLTWGNPSNATTFEIEVLPASGTPLGSGTIISASGDPVNYTVSQTTAGAPFTPNTPYQFFVRAICSADNVPSAWVGPINFSTATPGLSCASPIQVTPLPYVTNDNTGAYSDAYDTPQPATCIGSMTNFMAGNEVWYSYTPAADEAILVTLDPGAGNSSVFVYDGCANVGVSCLGGVANASADIRELTLNVVANHNYIIVVSSSAATQTYDYTLVIQHLNCLPPTNINIISTGPSSATVAFDNTSGITTWEVAVQPVGSPLPTGAGITVDATAAASITTLLDGTPLTLGCYQLSARIPCGDGTFSPWTTPVVFCTTNCTSGCTYQFILTDAFGDGWNGGTMTVTQDATTVVLGENFTDGTGPITVPVTLCDGDFTLTWSDSGSFPAEMGIQVVNSFGQTLYTHPSGTDFSGQVLFNGLANCSVPACLPPTALTPGIPDLNAITVDWTPAGPETAWEVIAVPAGSLAPASDDPGWTAAPSHPATITGLAQATNYDVYVRAICDGNNPSSMAGPLSAHTSSCPAADQCMYTFTLTDAFGDGWNGNTMDVRQNGITVATIGSTFTDGLGPISVQVPLCHGVPFDLFWNTGGNFATEVGVSITSFLGEMLYTHPSGTNLQGTTLYTGTGECIPPTCLKPTSIVVSNAGLDSATVAWTDPNDPDAAQWEILVLPAGSPAPAQTDTGTVVSTNPYTLTGLNSSTAYVVYVRALCSDTDHSLWSQGTAFNTVACLAADQCLYTFTLTDAFGDGWNGNTMSVIQGGLVVATLGANFTDGLGPIVVQVPLCNGIPFDLFWNTGGNFMTEVGVSITSFLGDPIFTHVAGTDNSGTTLYSGVGECIVPTCLKPNNVFVTSTSVDSVTVSWNENNTPAATQWEILVLPATDPAPLPTDLGTVVTSNPYTFGGLAAGTQYKVYVRAICSDTDNSFWSLAVPFNTLICPPANLCEYTFVMTDAFGDGWNGNTMTIAQNGIPVQTLTGPTETDGQNPVSVTVSLCNEAPVELIWNTGGFFATEVGIAIANQDGTTIFNHDAGTDDSGTTIYTGTVACVPATCPKPVQLLVNDITQTSAMLFWTESGTSTQWEILVLPAGSPPPTPSTPGTLVTDNPHMVTGLDSGTSYVFYVRAICSDTDVSNWAGPKPFVTLITNDDCATATPVPVNPDQSCAETVAGTVNGATPSANPNGCFGTADDDVWFSFVATSSAVSIDLINVAGSTTDLFHVVYSGDCNNLNQLYCSDDNQSVATGLTVGETYYIRVFTWTGNPGQTTSFNVCIGTIPPPITVTQNEFTPEQLIENILLNSTCAGVSNITYSTGTNFGSVNGIGYFEKNGSSFPFNYGLVLSTGDANLAPGPNQDIQSEGDEAWSGDADLSALLADQGVTGTLGNATSMQFDFVPVTNNISFNFVFASEEYGVFQCQYSDVFAFLLTDLTSGVTTNLAVVPNTNIPISVTTIHNGLYNDACGSANEAYFGSYFLDPGESPLVAPINFNGMTVPMTASADVIPGHQYHIKLAIADFGPFGYDGLYDSAVFLEGGSFGIGNINLGNDLLQATGNAICPGGSTTLQTDLDPTLYNFQWQVGTPPVDIPDATNPSLSVTAPGTYTLNVNFTGTSCIGSQSIVVEYYDPIVPGTPDDLYFCSAGGIGTFDLTQNEPLMLAPLTGNYTFTYYLTQADSEAPANAIVDPTAYVNISNPQTIYVRVDNTDTGCTGYTTFQLIVQDLTPQFTLPADFTVCANGPATISVVPGNYDPAEATYAWTFNSGPLADTTPTINVTDSGLYEVTVNFHGCTATHGVNVTVLPAPAAQVLPDISVCHSYVLPVLDPGNVYHDQSGGAGNMLAEGSEITTSGTVYIYNSNGTCADESSFTITINTAVADDMSNVSACVSYTLGALSVGNTYWSAAGGPSGGGTQYNPGDVISSVGTTTIWIWAESGTVPNCTDQSSFDVTIGQVTADTSLDIVRCDHYTLPALSAGNHYYNGPDASQGEIAPGTDIMGSQLIYIYAGDATCHDQSSFFVTINQTPVLSPIQNVSACDSYTLPSPQAGAHYYSASGGVGQLSDNEVITAQGTTTVYEYAQTGTAPDLCSAEASFTVTITPSPSASQMQDVTACDSYVLQAPASGTIYTQQGGGGTPYDLSQPVSATTTFYVYASNGSCSNQTSFTVTITPSPVFTIDSGCQGAVFVLTASATNFDPSTATYQWSAGAGGQVVSTDGASATVSGAATYSVMVTSGDCTSSAQTIAVDNTGCLIQKGISPNGDGMNDTFDLAGQNVSHLEIFNRYGTKVYEKANYTNQWGGQSDNGQELPDGVYYYVIRYTAGDSKTGWIYINREQN